MLLYLHGFASGPSSFKARALTEQFGAIGISLTVPDLTPGVEGFEQSTLSTMLAIARKELDTAPPPHAIIGSSLGGYLAALLSGERQDIARLVLMAPAFGFQERWRRRLTPVDFERWRLEGLEVDHHVTKSRRRLHYPFWEEAQRWPSYPEVRTPTLCIAGSKDLTVPLEDIAVFHRRTSSSLLEVVEDGHELADSIPQIFAMANRFLAPLYPDRGTSTPGRSSPL